VQAKDTARKKTRRKKADPAWIDPSTVEDPSLAFSVSQQPAMVYSLLPRYFAVSHGENNHVNDVETSTSGIGRVVFGVIAFSGCTSKAAAFRSKHSQAKADLLLQEAMRMLESENEDSEQDEEV